MGTNPCAEIALNPFQFCNLVEVNASDVKNQEDLNDRVYWASVIGTLQASYTDFHYLRPIWKETTEREALLGIGMTGIASGAVMNLDLELAVGYASMANETVSEQIGINRAARITCVKPSGTSSLVLGTSSGIHAWHDEYYVRRMRIGKNEAIYTYMSIYHPEMLEDDVFKPTQQAVVSVPQMAPSGAITRSKENAIEFLERVKYFHKHWIMPGHWTGDNTHNVSATVTMKHDEWPAVGEWLWENKKHFNGLSFLPEDLGTYVQTPFETITKERYEQLVTNLNALNVANIVEISDNTNLTDQQACGGGNCEIQ
jgi:ribonucleoside-diphosphate reductase alpha chain